MAVMVVLVSYFQFSAKKINLYPCVTQIGFNGRHSNGAGSCPAGKRFSAPSLPYTHPQMTTIDHIDKLCIYSLRKNRMLFKFWSNRLKIQVPNVIIHKNYAMRIAHRNTSNMIDSSIYLQRLFYHLLLRIRNRDLSNIQSRHTHIHTDRMNRSILYLQLQKTNTTGRIDRQIRFVG